MKIKRIPIIVITLGMIAILFLTGKLMKPSIQPASPDEILATEINPDSLIEGRHYDMIRVDSFVHLISKINTPAPLVNIAVNDSIRIQKTTTLSNPAFQRIFLNKRSPEDFKRLKNCAVVPNPKGTGYAIPIEKKNGTDYAPIPYDLIAGIITELNNQQ